MVNLRTLGLEPHDCKTVSAGDRFGRLTITAIGKKPGTYRYMAVCDCDCGTKDYVARLDGLTRPRDPVVGCGCVQKERTTTHGMTKHPLYQVWRHMMQRCDNPDDGAYENYGGRGVTVCERWRSVENFVADMAEGYQPGLEIERIDNSGNYEPGNCRWATHQENADNRRSAIRLTYNGKTQSLARWAEEIGMSYGTLWERVKVWGWPAEKALATPALSKDERMKIARDIRWGKSRQVTEN